MLTTLQACTRPEIVSTPIYSVNYSTVQVSFAHLMSTPPLLFIHPTIDPIRPSIHPSLPLCAVVHFNTGTLLIARSITLLHLPAIASMMHPSTPAHPLGSYAPMLPQTLKALRLAASSGYAIAPKTKANMTLLFDTWSCGPDCSPTPR